ncbi:hypothetical protein SPSYN_00625 [Sporotomaculum syntrophicum]|uniref:Uncharacterized protein n=1 Tax=Sporotomaculum syntrophicum TaxID=182264 RepID=A0A9D2WRQ0_9FIRM|nr:hypothetical protein SPSYN_00625 [Sporotomaculum syntrophicum]
MVLQISWLFLIIEGFIPGFEHKKTKKLLFKNSLVS